MIDKTYWGVFLIIGFLLGISFTIGCVAMYSHQWNEEQSVAMRGIYWQGFDDGWSKCGCGQGSGGGESQMIEWNWTQYPNWTSNPTFLENT